VGLYRRLRLLIIFCSSLIFAGTGHVEACEKGATTDELLRTLPKIGWVLVALEYVADDLSGTEMFAKLSERYQVSQFNCGKITLFDLESLPPHFENGEWVEMADGSVELVLYGPNLKLVSILQSGIVHISLLTLLLEYEADRKP